jgi:uncharacterized membrane protein
MTETGIPQKHPQTGFTQILYLLHFLAPFTAWLLAPVAIVMAAATRDKVCGTWLDTHYSWLARTFWWGLLWIVISWIITGILFLTIVGIILVWIPWTILFLWYLYRVVRGWIRLNDGQPAPQ